MNKYLCCPKCGGAGLVKDTDGSQYRCPVCMALVWADDSFSVKWDDSKKEFDVLLTFSNSAVEDVKQISKLPSLIAENSQCSCGGLLRVTNHAFKTTKEGIIFSGSFVCTTCRGENRPIISKVQDGILSVWTSLKKVKIGSIEIEK